ncbi:hypothetical protein AC1031_002261 [Aphanomyces cochlioides]|nr:hypothetical protein AC1031_002261 [Aphanomyces cochlioides]
MFTSTIDFSAVEETRDKPPEKKKRPNMYQIRQREELRRLQQEVTALKAQVRAVETSSSTREEDTSFWKRMAQTERVEKNKALYENETLRVAVGQQATFIDQMRKVFLKKPRLMFHQDVHSEEWQAYRLAAQASLRHAAIHAIADRQLWRLDHALLRAGLLDRHDDVTKAELVMESDHSLTYQIIRR